MFEDFDPSATYVTATEWSVSYTLGGGKPGTVLNVHRCEEAEVNAWGGRGVVHRHPVHDGLPFATRDAATAYAVRNGLLRRYVRPEARKGVELVMVRDPDGPTGCEWFRDGVPVSAVELGITVYDVDPGASGGDEEWRRAMESRAASASPEAGASIRQAVDI